jgi:hypothetical protein
MCIHSPPRSTIASTQLSTKVERTSFSGPIRFVSLFSVFFMVPYLANMGAAEAVFGGSDVCLQGRAGLVCDTNAHQSAT